MTTNVTVQYGGDPLLERSRQQQQAARQAKLHADRVKAQAQQDKAKREREGTLPSQQRYGVPQPPALRKDEPAAWRQQAGVIVNGVAVSTVMSTSVSETDIDWTVRIFIRPLDANSPTEFVYPYRTNDWFGQASPSGLPDHWPTTFPNDIAAYYYLFPYSSDPFVAGLPYRKVFNDNDYSGGSCSIANDYQITWGSDLSRTLVLPDGRGGAYVIFVLNRLARKQWDRTTKTVTTTRSLRAYQMVGGFSDTWVGERNIVWNFAPDNPVGTTGVQYPTDEQIAAINRSLPHIWTGTSTLTSERTVVKELNVNDYAIHLYRVAGAQVTEVNVPPELDAWIRKINPPQTINSTGTINYVLNIQYNRNVTPGHITSTIAEWDGTSTTIYGEPAINPNPVNTIVSENYSYPIHDEVIYYNQPDVVSLSVLDYGLVTHLGGVSPYHWSDPQARGPSLAFASDKDLKSFLQGSGPGEYAPTIEFLGVSPTFYVSSCVDEGQCEANQVVWSQTKSQPDLNLPTTAFRPVRNGAFTVPDWVESEHPYQLYWLTNWGNPALCRRGLSMLGIR